MDEFILTGAPGVAEQRERAQHTAPLRALSKHTQLKSVAAHRGGGRRGDEDGGLQRVRALGVKTGRPARGRSRRGESHRHDHIQGTWGEGVRHQRTGQEDSEDHSTDLC